MPNRVEELELTVSELESTIDGLTEELVETKERVRTLEEVLERELDGELPARDEDIDGAPTTEAEPDEVRAAAAEADAETETEAEGAKGSDAEDTENDGDDSELDDIIVA
jgi:uncharacterized coiled-coil protein SlyX